MPKLKTVFSLLFGNPQQKYESRFKLLSYLAHKWGFKVYNMNLAWHKDVEYLNDFKGFSGGGKDVHDRKFVLYHLSKACKHLEANTAECGVYKGASSYLILKAMQNSKQRTHFVFDSFEGLSVPEKNDKPDNLYSFHWKENDLSIAEEIVHKNLIEFQHVILLKGWIPTRFDEVKENKFCFVHIDVDLYQPTYDSFAFFYERTVKDGMIVCDDYGFESCPGARKAMDDFFKDKPEHIIHLSTGQSFVIKQ